MNFRPGGNSPGEDGDLTHFPRRPTWREVAQRLSVALAETPTSRAARATVSPPSARPCGVTSAPRRAGHEGAHAVAGNPVEHGLEARSARTMIQ